MEARRVDSRIVVILLTLVAIAGAIALMQYNTQEVSGAVIGNPGTAAYYIKFDGIDGEALDKDHSGWSDLNSFGQALRTSIVDLSSDGTRRRGDVILEDISLSKQLDKASPKLAEAVTSGMVFPKVEIHVTASYTDAGRVTYYKYELTNVMVTSYSVSGTGSVDDVPMEQVSLNFAAIKVTYTENDSSGQKKGNVEYTWNVEQAIN